MENIFSKSEKFTQEYCCTIVKVGELNPIEGADKIAQTIVNGESIVVRKDQVKKGDILFYASNETQLNEGFLSANNLFDVDFFEKNSNSKELMDMAKEKEMLKKTIDNTNKMLSKVKKAISSDSIKPLKEFVRKYDKSAPTSNIDALKEKSKELIAQEIDRLNEVRDEIDNIKKEMRSRCGFFNKYGRVKLIRLKGVPSFGYLFTAEELAKWMGDKVLEVNLEEHVGEDFDSVCGELFVKAYVPPIKEAKNNKSSKTDKSSRKAERLFDRLVEGQFKFHYDTNPLARNMDLISPSTKVTISVKEHGTSVIIANVKVKVPIKLPIYQRIINLFCSNRFFRKYKVNNYVEEYGPIYSSRKVIKNEYINPKVNEGFYESDIWSEYGNLMYKYLDKGMTVYGEIVGYLTESDKMIQSRYDYGCEIGTNKMMPYRITTTQEDGKVFEWNVTEVYEWTLNVMKNHEELREKLVPIDILYHGTLKDAYPNIEVNKHWHENVLQAMKDDQVMLGMELLEPKCKNLVPREGIVLRIDNDTVSEAFKLKCETFLFEEQKLIDDNEVDIEMQETINEQPN